MKFYLHREEKISDNDTVFSYPGFIFMTVYRRCVHTQVWWS